MSFDEKILAPKTFRRFCDLVYAKAGIKLGSNKEALVAARVGKRMRKLGLTDFEDYCNLAEQDSSGAELVELLNAISTNVTHFFRESRHFELLGRFLREWENQGQTSFRIWCAASSTGEEPYSIAITVKDALRDIRDVKILATDISTRVLERARDGLYAVRQVDKTPERMLKIHFRREKVGVEVKYRVADELKTMITFARLNLAKPPFPMHGPFDVIFCRNVMIYFDNEVRRRLLADAYRLLKDGGYLMVGHAESLSGMLSDFKSVEPSVYIKQP